MLLGEEQHSYRWPRGRDLRAASLKTSGRKSQRARDTPINVEMIRDHVKNTRLGACAVLSFQVMLVFCRASREEFEAEALAA